MSKTDYSGQVNPGTTIGAVDQDGHFRSLRSTHMTRSPPESDIAESALFEGSSKTRITSNESKSALTSHAVREVKFHGQKKFQLKRRFYGSILPKLSFPDSSFWPLLGLKKVDWDVDFRRKSIFSKIPQTCFRGQI